MERHYFTTRQFGVILLLYLLAFGMLVIKIDQVRDAYSECEIKVATHNEMIQPTKYQYYNPSEFDASDYIDAAKEVETKEDVEIEVINA